MSAISRSRRRGLSGGAAPEGAIYAAVPWCPASGDIPLRSSAIEPAPAGKGYPAEWHTLYDWALVWRYWHGTAQGLRRPYPLEVQVLVRLGRGLTDEQLAERVGVQRRQVQRWRTRFAAERPNQSEPPHSQDS